jgi:hypothetical protein
MHLIRALESINIIWSYIMGHQNRGTHSTHHRATGNKQQHVTTKPEAPYQPPAGRFHQAPNPANAPQVNAPDAIAAAIMAVAALGRR